MVFPLLPGSTPTPPPRHGPEINGSVLRDPPGVPNPTNGGGVISFPHTKPGVPTSWKTSPTSPTTPLTDLGRRDHFELSGPAMSCPGERPSSNDEEVHRRLIWLHHRLQSGEASRRRAAAPVPSHTPWGGRTARLTGTAAGLSSSWINPNVGDSRSLHTGEEGTEAPPLIQQGTGV